MRKAAVWRLVLTMILVAVVAALYAGATHDTRYGLSVAEYVAGGDIPGGRFMISGVFDPESVRMQDEMVRFDLLASESFDATRVTVVADAEDGLPPEAWSIDECFGRVVEDGMRRVRAVEHPAVFFRQEGPYRWPGFHPYEFARLSLVPKHRQLARLLGHDAQLERVYGVRGVQDTERGWTRVYEDIDGSRWVWNEGTDTWVARLPDDIDQVPGRTYPGELSLEECLERADALAAEYYTGPDGIVGMYRSWHRRVQENAWGVPAIVSYDVTYQRYLAGIRMPDTITVTVFALSGGSDFVGPNRTEEVTFTLQPRVSPLTADRTCRQRVDRLPLFADLVSFELVASAEGLTWHMGYDWEPLVPERPDRVYFSPAPSEATIYVDAVSGDVVGSTLIRTSQ